MLFTYYVINAIFDSKRGPNVINFSIFHPILTQFFLQNDHLIELLVGHSNILVYYFWKGSKSTRILKCFTYLKGIYNFYFSFDFIIIFFYLLSWELPVVCQWISSISIGEKLNRENKSRIPKFELSYFSSNFNADFCKWSSLWVIDGPVKKMLFYF